MILKGWNSKLMEDLSKCCRLNSTKILSVNFEEGGKGTLIIDRSKRWESITDWLRRDAKLKIRVLNWSDHCFFADLNFDLIIILWIRLKLRKFKASLKIPSPVYNFLLRLFDQIWKDTLTWGKELRTAQFEIPSRGSPKDKIFARGIW